MTYAPVHGGFDELSSEEVVRTAAGGDAVHVFDPESGEAIR